MQTNLNAPRIDGGTLLDSDDFDKLAGLDVPHQSSRVASRDARDRAERPPFIPQGSEWQGRREPTIKPQEDQLDAAEQMNGPTWRELLFIVGVPAGIIVLALLGLHFLRRWAA